jgi:hypothetical protein
LAQLACWPIRPASPSGPPSLAKPTGSGLGRSNRPSPAPIAPLSLSRHPSGDLVRRRHRLATPAISGGHRRSHHGRNAPLSTLFLLHRTDSVAASSARRSVAGSHSENRLSVATDLTTHRIPSLGMLCVLAVVQVCVLRRWC